MDRVPEGQAILNTKDLTMQEYSEFCKKHLIHEYKNLTKLLLKRYMLKQNSRVLEIGSGPGWISILLAQEDPSLEIAGIELSDDMLAVSNENKKASGVEHNVKFVKGDAKNMPFEDNSFDAIISNDSLHHWDDPVWVFNEIARILKKGGVFIIKDCRRDIGLRAKVIIKLAKIFMPKTMYKGWVSSIKSSYTQNELEKMLKHSSLKDWEIRTTFMDLTILKK
ncbi:MAG: class I SAM-dependent methyltransferase [Candidatus Helarchaeota archaeon]